VGFACLLITAFARSFRYWRSLAAKGLLVAALVFVGLRFYSLLANDGGTSRFDVAIQGQYPLAPLNFLSNAFLEFSILLWPLGLVAVLVIFIERNWWRRLGALIGAILVPLAVAIVALDQTRDTMLAASPTLLASLVVASRYSSNWGWSQKTTALAYLILLVVLLATPAVQVTYTGSPMSPFSQIVHQFFPQMPVGW
jgi:glucose-6-phosphate-specific signal transduction histidine kinase